MNSSAEMEERDQNKLDSLICDTLKAIQEIQSFVGKSSEPRIICNSPTDPSIQFFGIDWHWLFNLCNQLREALKSHLTSPDPLLLQKIFCWLAAIEDQIVQHSLALEKGNLGSKKRRETEILQRRVALMARSSAVNSELKRTNSIHLVSRIQNLVHRIRKSK